MAIHIDNENVVGGSGCCCPPAFPECSEEICADGPRPGCFVDGPLRMTLTELFGVAVDPPVCLTMECADGFLDSVNPGRVIDGGSAGTFYLDDFSAVINCDLVVTGEMRLIASVDVRFFEGDTDHTFSHVLNTTCTPTGVFSSLCSPPTCQQDSWPGTYETADFTVVFAQGRCA